MLRKFTLDNGLRVVCEKIPFVRSVSFGVWIGTGSRNEPIEINGISHFIEHMLFKGTENRTVKEIAESIDSLGGQLNAFTGKECTCFYTKTLDTHVDIAADVLSDMLFNAKLSPADIEVEKKVILEEIGMYEDSPEELVSDLLSETVWSGDPLGYPILGTDKSLKGLKRESFTDYMASNYIPSNSVIAVAGNFEDEKLEEIICRYFGKWNGANEKASSYASPVFNSDYTLKEKDTEQAHICLGFEGIEQGNDSLYTLLAINNVFGGGMSSKLFQRIREEKGLVYSIYSYPSAYKHAGLYTIYAGMNPEYVNTVNDMVLDEIDQLKQKGLSSDELTKSKEQLKGNYILGLEGTGSRMNSIGKAELLHERISSPEQILNKIDNITMESVEETIQKVFDTDKMSFTAVGNLKKEINIVKQIYKKK